MERRRLHPKETTKPKLASTTAKKTPTTATLHPSRSAATGSSTSLSRPSTSRQSANHDPSSDDDSDAPGPSSLSKGKSKDVRVREEGGKVSAKKTTKPRRILTTSDEEDSPDPLLLTPTSSNKRKTKSKVSSPSPSRSKFSLMDIDKTPRPPKAQRSRVEPLKQAKRTAARTPKPSETSASSCASDAGEFFDMTSRKSPGANSKSKAKADSRTKAQSKQVEDREEPNKTKKQPLSEADKFFNEVLSRQKEEKALIGRIGKNYENKYVPADRVEVDDTPRRKVGSTSRRLDENEPITTSATIDDDIMMMNEQSFEMNNQDDVEEEDLSEFLNPSHQCAFCHKAMPRSPSAQLLIDEQLLLDQLKETSAPLSWTKTLSFCAQHDAESRVIPLGQRAGYPKEIDFNNLEERIESGFVATCLRRIAEWPQASALFNKVAKDIIVMGRARWAGHDYQASSSVQDGLRAGYFGELGREIMTRHFHHLLHWGHLSSLETDPNTGVASTIYPLSPSEFISFVLVPECAVLLIMSDKEWDDASPRHGEAWMSARRQARQLWKNSAEYGRFAFRDDDAVAEAVCSRLLRRVERTKKLVAEMRAEQRVADEKREKGKRARRKERDARKGEVVLRQKNEEGIGRLEEGSTKGHGKSGVSEGDIEILSPNLGRTLRRLSPSKQRDVGIWSSEDAEHPYILASTDSESTTTTVSDLESIVIDETAHEKPRRRGGSSIRIEVGEFKDKENGVGRAETPVQNSSQTTFGGDWDMDVNELDAVMKQYD